MCGIANDSSKHIKKASQLRKGAKLDFLWQKGKMKLEINLTPVGSSNRRHGISHLVMEAR